MGNLLLIMLGGGIGAVLRYIITGLFKKVFLLKHYATFIVNLTGCFILGVCLSYFYGEEHSAAAIFMITGIIGSYTTFSTFEYENIDLIAHEKYIDFLKYVTYSCICGVTAVLAGLFAGKMI
ncbi:MAG: CrcB family protein [Candidatus Gastranaerophilales bacterium]|nr:CrcB family protein [Candidatus Gastranaerophilales bacterium]